MRMASLGHYLDLDASFRREFRSERVGPKPPNTYLKRLVDVKSETQVTE
jgi:hypothetical protein